jgi:nucleoside-diphosphate-sugar epimerase
VTKIGADCDLHSVTGCYERSRHKDVSLGVNGYGLPVVTLDFSISQQASSVAPPALLPAPLVISLSQLRHTGQPTEAHSQRNFPRAGAVHPFGGLSLDRSSENGVQPHSFAGGLQLLSYAEKCPMCTDRHGRRRVAKVKLLVTGTEGYLGCLLAAELLQDGHEVVGVDTGYYKAGWLYNGLTASPRTLAKDIRDLTLEDLEGVEAIVHMAELSNDPLGELIPDITYVINHAGSVRLAELAKKAGVQRFVYMSSCSVYGVADGTVDETSPVNPQTAYADCKSLVERDVTALADDNFSPTFMRNATAFGASPRMRFDIVLNNLSGLAWTTNRIAMTSDGTPWRPLVHALDIAKAIRCALAAPREVIHSNVFNVGSNEQNYQVKEIAETIAAVFPGCELSFGDSGGDNRSYKVNFDKISSQLPGFSCDWDAEKGARQLLAVFEKISLDTEVFTGRGHTRLKQLEYLMKTQQLDSDLFWSAP